MSSLTTVPEQKSLDDKSSQGVVIHPDRGRNDSIPSTRVEQALQIRFESENTYETE